MTYGALEVLGGEPVELFKFVYGATSWFWTSGVESVVKSGDTYSPIAIVSGNTSADGEAQANSIQVTVVGSNAVAELFKNNQPVSPIQVYVYRQQRGDAEFITIFAGEIGTCSFGDVNAVFSCYPAQSVAQRKIATLSYQALCNNRLYDSRCQVVRASFTYTYAVTAIAVGNGEATYDLGGNSETFFAVEKLNWLTAGTVQFGDQVLMIVYHIGNKVTVMDSFTDLIVGNTLTLYAGCDKQVSTCRDKFVNLARHQGFPYLPGENPSKAGFLMGTNYPFATPFPVSEP